MAFFFYEINTDRFILATNLKAVSEFSGIPYHKIYNWFQNGSDVHKDEKFFCVKAEVVRGKQRIQKGQSSSSSTSSNDNTGPSSVTPKRETKQPDSRDMSKYDDFFKQVGEAD